MADVFTGIYLELPTSTDRSGLVTKWSLPKDVEILESRPGNSTTVKRDPGLQSHGPLSIEFDDDASQTFLQYIDGALGTKVAFLVRKDSAAKGAGNMEWTGTCIIAELPGDAGQGEKANYTVAFAIDGAAAGAV